MRAGVWIKDLNRELSRGPNNYHVYFWIGLNSRPHSSHWSAVAVVSAPQSGQKCFFPRNPSQPTSVATSTRIAILKMIRRDMEFLSEKREPVFSGFIDYHLRGNFGQGKSIDTTPPRAYKLGDAGMLERRINQKVSWVWPVHSRHDRSGARHFLSDTRIIQ